LLVPRGRLTSSITSRGLLPSVPRKWEAKSNRHEVEVEDS
jgi:hypothetical protein